MPIPTYGAAPLSTTFLGVRVTQVISLIIMLGLAGNAINQMAMQNFDPSREIVGTISIVRPPSLFSSSSHQLTLPRPP
jgi:hypothetical protein